MNPVDAAGAILILDAVTGLRIVLHDFPGPACGGERPMGMFRQNCSKNQSLAEHSVSLLTYTSLIINAIIYLFNAASIASMASVLAFSAMSM